MKLPEKHAALRFMPGGLNSLEQRLVEAVVRDIAEAVSTDIMNRDEGWVLAQAVANTILARYGLEPTK